MALVFLDGFEQYTTSLIGSSFDNYTGGFAISNPGRFGGKGLTVSSTNAKCSKTFGQNSVAFGFAMRVSSIANSPGYVNFLNLESIRTAQVRFYYNQLDGSIQITNTKPGGTNVDVLGNTKAGVIVAGRWVYLEAEVLCHETVGSINFFVDGALVLSLSGVTTKEAGNDVYLLSITKNGGLAHDIDDMYISNVATRLGECQISTVPVNADTAQKDFTPLSGTDNFAMVNSLPYNSAKYVSANVIAKEDLYNLSALPGTPSDIKAVACNIIGLKTASGYRTIRTEIDSGGVAAHGTESVLNTSLVGYQTAYDKDPATNAAWTQAAVNALKIGMSTVA